MPGYYTPLPQENIQNALINYQPLNEGLDTIREQNNSNRNALLQQKQFDAQAGERTYQHGRDAKGDARQQVTDYGKQAMAVAGLPDGPEKQAIWQRILQQHQSEHPGELTPEESDHRTGPKLMAAQAGMFLDPNEQEMSRLKLAGARDALANGPIDREYKQAQIKALGQKDIFNEAIAGLLKQPDAPTPAAPQQSPIQPQSFNGQGPQGQNGLILAADQQPAQQPPPAPTAPAMVDTPMGPMSADRAKRMGMALALGGKGDAGKLLTDAASGGTSLSKTAENQNDKEEISATNQIATLDNIKKSYDAKFLNIPNRFKLWGNNLAAKFGQLNPQDQQDLKDYAGFRQSTWHNLNRVLKDLSGTAVTENEMQRQLLDQPNPGQGIADGDSPQEFEAKLKGQVTFAHSAVARARYLRTKGFTGKPWEAGVAVEDMPGIINQRGAELEQQLKAQNPKADPMQLQDAVKNRIKQEFGI